MVGQPLPPLTESLWRCNQVQSASANTLLPLRGLRPLATAGGEIGLE
jgi:hypothetical protein